MGCTGSKPHLLLSSTITTHHHHHHLHHNTHANSPQKGFILFNEKTFEYLKENEASIKQKLMKRVEAKLANGPIHDGKSTISGSSSISKALFSNAKRTLLPNLASHNNNVDPNVSTSTEKTKVTDTIANLTTSSEASSASCLKFKDIAIDSAVDYVLKYAINDFDIDNFKSSNQLSLKQIRKDIMKKTNNRESLSKINTVLNQQQSQTPTVMTKSTSGDMAFYKSALHAAIDEFGSFIQENFIVINEYEKRESTPSNGAPDEASKKSSLKSGLSAEEEESLKLKEAIELARQNFYKGKLSMVCLTKAGGYVVKEIKEPTMDSLATTMPNESSHLVSNSVTIDSLASANTGPVDALSVSSPQTVAKSEQTDSKTSITTNVGIFTHRFIKK
jgi:hypothetical protein